MNSSELMKKITALKNQIDDVKTVGVLYKPARVQSIVESAIYIIEEMATEQQRLESLVDDLVQTGLGLGESVNG